MADQRAPKRWSKVPLKTSMHIRVLHQTVGWSVSQIRRDMYPRIPLSTVRYHAKLSQDDDGAEDKRKSNPGRPSKLSATDLRRLRRKVDTLRRTDSPNFSAVTLAKVCGLDHVHKTTIHRALKRHSI